MKAWHWIAGSFLLFSLIGCDGEAVEGTRRGQRAPEVEGDTPKGDFIRLSDYRGKVVVLDFWATWCGPCVQSMPDTARLLKRYENRPLVIIGVSQDRDRQLLQAFLERNSFIVWPNIFDGMGGPISERWSINMLPTMVVIDHTGIIRHTRLHPDDLEDVIDPLVRAAESS